MSVTVAIPSQTIALGSSILGPFTPGVGLGRASISLGLAALAGTLTIAVDTSEDGVTWRELGSCVGVGGTPELTVDLGNTGDPPVQTLTTATTQFRVRLNASVAFLSAGGSFKAV